MRAVARQSASDDGPGPTGCCPTGWRRRLALSSPAPLPIQGCGRAGTPAPSAAREPRPPLGPRQAGLRPAPEHTLAPSYFSVAAVCVCLGLFLFLFCFCFFNFLFIYFFALGFLLWVFWILVGFIFNFFFFFTVKLCGDKLGVLFLLLFSNLLSFPLPPASSGVLDLKEPLP